MLIHHLVSAGNLHVKDFIIRKKKTKKKNVRTVVGIDISAWGCKMVSSSERDVVLCNEWTSAPVTFSGVVALNSVAMFGIILIAACIAMCVDPLFCLVMSFLRCASTLCFVWLCRSFHPRWHRKLSCKMCKMWTLKGSLVLLGLLCISAASSSDWEWCTARKWRYLTDSWWQNRRGLWQPCIMSPVYGCVLYSPAYLLNALGSKIVEVCYCLP